MTPPEPAADFEQALDELELSAPVAVVFVLAPLAAIAATPPTSPFFPGLAVLVARLAELHLHLNPWIW
ncbi:hypothetical protein Lesp02_84310 [Lentzea sp. NBRC 105346]|uniref:hypothetical protein n=1 Tax=Lentzea sp. NBRC 105346 TaxID=3032205 RepID=UPI0024A12AA5|nr:hypothetical protein [Lentzea sp. NBRC 105346]GLZ36244.1 hypothetical protein Lesp02_84310 [Lentzea sp. NBRC 105346]